MMCNALRLPDMSPLRAVVATESCDDMMRVEVLDCGHKKVTWTAMDRPAKRRRCHKCDEKDTR